MDYYVEEFVRCGLTLRSLTLQRLYVTDLLLYHLTLRICIVASGHWSCERTRPRTTTLAWFVHRYINKCSCLQRATSSLCKRPSVFYVVGLSFVSFPP